MQPAWPCHGHCWSRSNGLFPEVFIFHLHTHKLRPTVEKYWNSPLWAKSPSTLGHGDFQGCLCFTAFILNIFAFIGRTRDDRGNIFEKSYYDALSLSNKVRLHQNIKIAEVAGKTNKTKTSWKILICLIRLISAALKKVLFNKGRNVMFDSDSLMGVGLLWHLLLLQQKPSTPGRPCCHEHPHHRLILRPNKVSFMYSRRKSDKTWLQGQSFSHLITGSLRRLITLSSPLSSLHSLWTFSPFFLPSSLAHPFSLNPDFTLCLSLPPVFPFFLPHHNTHLWHSTLPSLSLRPFSDSFTCSLILFLYPPLFAPSVSHLFFHLLPPSILVISSPASFCTPLPRMLLPAPFFTPPLIPLWYSPTHSPLMILFYALFCFFSFSTSLQHFLPSLPPLTSAASHLLFFLPPPPPIFLYNPPHPSKWGKKR